MRIAVTGPPGTGKTTLSRLLGERYCVAPYHTDDLIHMGWSEASDAAARWFDLAGPLVVEGVAVPRALRKWLDRDPGKPIDELLVLTQQWVPLTGGRAAMAKGLWTVLEEIEGQLSARGVVITRAGDFAV